MATAELGGDEQRFVPVSLAAASTNGLLLAKYGLVTLFKSHAHQP